MKYLIVFATVILGSLAQRPSFAGLSPKGIPELASRFKTDSSDSSAGSSGTGTTSTGGIANRAGVDDNSVSSTTIRLPVDARGDSGLVNRISQWPRENQPFWYINADHIEKHRNPQGTNQKTNVNLNQQQTQTLDNRNSFNDYDYYTGWTGNQQGGSNYPSKNQKIGSSNSYSGGYSGKQPNHAEKGVFAYFR